MPHLVKVQEQYKAQGFIIIASHRQDVTQDKVCALCRSSRVNYTVVSGAGLQGDDSRGIPHAWLFDGSGKCIMDGHAEEMSQKIDELLRTEPHWIARGRKLESKDAKAVSEGLKAGKTFGWALGELEHALKKDDKTKEEATFLKEQVLGEGEKLLASAKEAEADDAFRAQSLYEEVARGFKKSDLSKQADDRLKELKADKAFQEELKAGKLVSQIDALCAQLFPNAADGKYDLTSTANRDTAAQINAGSKQLKKYTGSKAAEKCLERLKGYGFN
jgi:hypothetical protein